MSTLRVLATLAIVVGCCAPAAVLADQLSPEPVPKLEEVASTESAPQTDPAHATQERCPYRFDSDMPAATFCVYRGVAWGGAGEVCATDVVVIWSSVASQPPVSEWATEKPSASTREVYVGFVADPELVVRAIVDSRNGDRAEMVGYTVGSQEAPQPLVGQVTLRAAHLGAADVFSMQLRQPRRFHPESCAFASYSGTFFGMIQPPEETTTSVDPFLVPRR